jgi:hypothetical protein
MLKGPPPSERKAATTIQAHWRGHELRRTRPLEKLQLICQVRQDLKDHMQVLAGSAQWEKLCSDPKERLRWSECAMALLLRLVIAFQKNLDSTSKDASTGKDSFLNLTPTLPKYGFKNSPLIN